MDAERLVEAVVSASLRVLPLACAALALERTSRAPRAAVGAAWWAVSALALVSLLLPPVLDLALPPLVAGGLAGAWLLLVVVGAAREAGAAVRLRRLVAGAVDLNGEAAGERARAWCALMGIELPPRIARSAVAPGPCVFGPLSPTVLLPDALADAPDDALDLVLVHELAHVRHRDLVFALVPALGRILFPFHPALRRAPRIWGGSREAACDAAAVALTGASPAAYAGLLLRIVTPDQRGGLSPALGATADFRALRERIEEMNRPHLPRLDPRLALATALPFAALGLAFPAPAETNLARNPGFEEGSALPAGWAKGSLLGDAEASGVSALRVTNERHSGKASLRFVRTTQRYNPVLILNRDAALPAGTKRLRTEVWMKAERAGKATVAIWFNDANGETTKIEWGAYLGEDEPVTHGWRRYGAVVEVPEGTKSLTLSLQMYGPGRVWMDDLVVAPAPSDAPLVPAVKEG